MGLFLTLCFWGFIIWILSLAATAIFRKYGFYIKGAAIGAIWGLILGVFLYICCLDFGTGGIKATIVIFAILGFFIVPRLNGKNYSEPYIKNKMR